MARDSLAFIGSSYQPLAIISGLTRDPPSRPSCPSSTKTDHRLVGRLHYLLRATLSAQFRWGFCASDVLTLLPSTGVLRSAPDYMDAGPTGQYGTLPIPTANQRRRLDFEFLAYPGGIVRVLLSRGRMCAARSVQPQQGNLDQFGDASTSSAAGAIRIPRSKWPLLRSAPSARSTIWRYDAWSESLNICGPILILEVESKRPTYAADRLST